ncbi:family 78 glycoside hydrolase catalytic domain [Paenibacillus odorifer]|uniref:alpha-L-rhamnosidase n=1 Tax=Paenibacillus odorifer TaxID=189426 RepID=A0AAD0P3F3_9BACL|nr:family 78 glycoside hydrolase catalytic domain [Paenibacillus odorifer]AWV33075.1 alpha-L-rhamnosidase [Paenibacillus odorifer]
MFAITKLRCEYKENPLGIDVIRPRISWQLVSDDRDCMQSAYQIQVAENMLFQGKLWDTEEVKSSQSIHVELEGLLLAARTRYYYRVRAWNQNATDSGWSEIAFFETGLLDAGNWQAEWISAPTASFSQDSEICPQLRTFVDVKGPVESARIYVTALGLYELQLNGSRVGDHYFTPGWTSYSKRLQYQTYDVTKLLHEGANALGALLGNGWYRGYLGWDNQKEIYGSKTSLLLELHIRYADGSNELISSNQNWQAAKSAIMMSEIYNGETYDARLELDITDPSSEGWHPVEIINYSKAIIVAQENVPVTQVETLKPIALLTTPQGDRVLDMGQNMVGWLKFNVKGQSGQAVELQHAEILDRDGNFYTENMRKAKQCIRYTLKGGEQEAYEPHFTFQGFRYVKLSGFSADLQLEDFTGIVMHSNMERTGDFQCSDPLVNQLHHNILWGQKGNFLDVPTDCPQRDERLGWTGDAQMFVRTASYLMNTAPFFTKWLRDLKADQTPEGGIPFFIPELRAAPPGDGDTNHSSAAWGDAATICPWTIYEMYGDKRLLAEQYESMKHWISYIYAQGSNPYIWNTGFHFGDWLALDSKPDSYVGATDRDYVATAFYAYSVSLTLKAAIALEKSEDVDYYSELHVKIIKAFSDEFITPAGRLSVSTQTAQILALRFDLVEGVAKERAIQKLTELLAEAKDHLTTGFVGTPYLNPVLSESGNNELAYKLLFQKDYPSWLYQVTKGATTIWEHWDGIKEDGSFWSADMNSFNHYAYGAIGEWLYRYVAGIGTDELEPGFKIVHIKPQPGPGLDYAEASLETMYGKVESAWLRSEDNGMMIRVTIPANTNGIVVLPGANQLGLLENGVPVEQSRGVHSISLVDNGVRLELGSGSYQFTYSL